MHEPQPNISRSFAPKSNKIKILKKTFKKGLQSVFYVIECNHTENGGTFTTI